MAKATKADLVKEAEGLGIDVDGRWGIETLQERIDAAKAAQGQSEQGDAAEGSTGEGETVVPLPEASGISSHHAGAMAQDLVQAQPEGSGGLLSSVSADDASPPPDGESVGVLDAPDDGEGQAGSDLAGKPEGSDASAASGRDPVLNVTADQLTALKFMTWPILAAYQAACSVYGVNRRWNGEGVPLDADWILPGRDQPAKVIAIMRDAVPFVRTWPDAPAEALYGHVSSDGGVNPVLDRAWSDLGLVDQAAWTVFRDTLVTLDRFLASDAARNAAVEERPVYAASADEVTLETADERFAPSF
ncbi:hypothetical protein NS226_03805 [Aureimonas ureilytica]|uniref:Uncharacterized protein n=1 Tax=Aureimonas ureilytica TaxID=401562 RepID=A0A175REA5_9HYPH|nr:hypothetical protein [Aureimonas ureilytica]KTQ97776.1 hypothetical protein NS226_03805 [Aureimonas ureilytica]